MYLSKSRWPQLKQISISNNEQNIASNKIDEYDKNRCLKLLVEAIHSLNIWQLRYSSLLAIDLIALAIQ